MKSILLSLPKTFIAALLLFSIVNSNAQSLVAAWDFQTTAIGGTAAAAAPSSPVVFAANFGSGNIYLNGTNGSSTWVTATSGNEITAFGGTALNTTGGLSTVTSGASAIALLGGTANAANGKFMVLKFNMTGFTNLVVSYASQRTNTGFSSQIWEYSTDGTTWFPIQTVTTVGTSFSVITLNTITGLNDAANAYIRFSGTGATAVAGNNRLDNIQLRATAAAVPPTVTTLAATVGSPTQATLNGTVNANGATTTVTFDYGTSTSYGTSIAATPSSLSTSVATAVSATVNTLSANTQYHFRAVGTVSSVPTNGADLTFYTLANTPNAVAVGNPQSTTLDVTINTTTENGNPAVTQYAIQEAGSNYVQADGSLGASAVWQTAAQWGTITVTGLNNNTLYNFHIKARNGANVETSFSGNSSGTTLTGTSAGLTILTALQDFGSNCINSTVDHSFSFDGNNLDGSDILVNACAGYSYSLTQTGNYTNTLSISYTGTSISNQVVYVRFSPTVVQPYNGTISLTGGGLPSSFSVAATGSGINTSVGVSSVAATAVTDSTAILNGTLTAGCSNITGYGFELNTVNDFSNGAPSIQPANNLSSGSFSLALSGLEPNQTYYFRAYATDGAGTVYGTVLSFTLLNVSAPTANLGTSISSTAFTASWNQVNPNASYRLDVSTSPTFGITTNASNLFISEYGEGATGNKKYIEIYNGTGSTVNLANYQIWKNVNGSNWNFQTNNTTPTAPLSLTGNLANGATYVIANNSTDVSGANLYTTFLSFNGDDATGLAWNGGSGTTFTLIDVIGVESDPGTGWAVAGISNATADKILIRKPTVFSPNANWTSSAGTDAASSEWIVSAGTYNAANQTTNLGAHTFNNTNPSFVSGYQNLTVLGTSQVVSGLTENTNYYYRVRAVTTLSTSADSNIVNVLTSPAAPTFGGINQVVAVVCEDTAATFNVFGLLPNSISTISYNIDGGGTQTITGVASNPSGFATFDLVLPLANNGQTLTVTGIERTDLAGGSIAVTESNTAVLSVNANATYYADADGDGFGNAGASIVACDGAPAGYVADSTDCDDTDNTKHTSFEFYLDNDHDGFGAGSLMSVCAVNSSTPPFGYASNNTDCNDNDINSYQSALLYVDADGDGYNNGTSSVMCYGAVVPSGYTASDIGIDCNDAVAAINPGHAEVLYNGIDDNCDGQLDEGFQITTHIQTSQCGTTLASINSLISAVSTPQATGYRFEVTNTATNSVQIIETGLQFFSLNQLASYDYATTYSIRVMLKRNGIWLGYYGSACFVSSPAVLAPGGAAQVTPSQCGITLPSINTLISTTSLAGVTGYRFRVTNISDPSAPNQLQVIDRPLQWFSLPMLATYTYGTTYVIEVAVKTNGVYSGFGSACQITSPAVPSLAICGGSVATANTFIYTTSLAKVTSYRFEVTNLTTNQMTTIDRALHWFSFNNIPGFSPATQYGVRVALMTSGVYSLYSDACQIMSPGTARTDTPKSDNTVASAFTAIAYPNPFVENFIINLRTSSEGQITVKVYDMTGKLLESRNVEASEIESLKIGNNFPSGVYNVVVEQGENIKVIRVMKR